MPRSNSASLPTKCLTVAMTPRDCTPAHVRGGERARTAAGPPSSTRSCARRAASGAGSPSARAAPGSPRSAPPRRASAPSSLGQLRVPGRAERRPARDAGRRSPPPPPRIAGPRAPFGPSVTRTAFGMPDPLDGDRRPEVAPAVSAAFSSRVSAATRASMSRRAGESLRSPRRPRAAAVGTEAERARVRVLGRRAVAGLGAAHLPGGRRPARVRGPRPGRRPGRRARRRLPRRSR